MYKILNSPEIFNNLVLYSTNIYLKAAALLERKITDRSTR